MDKNETFPPEQAMGFCDITAGLTTGFPQVIGAFPQAIELGKEGELMACGSR